MAVQSCLAGGGEVGGAINDCAQLRVMSRQGLWRDENVGERVVFFRLRRNSVLPRVGDNGSGEDGEIISNCGFHLAQTANTEEYVK